MVEAELAKDAHRVHVLSQPDNLATAAAELGPDVIVIADRFADITGFELCGDLRMTEEGKHVAIVILSTVQRPENEVARALRAGADDCVSMDRRVELRARIQTRLRDKRYRDSLRRIRSERDRLRVAASIDTLTGLPNRTVLEDVLRQKMADGSAFAVLFLDIDFFKKVNDTFGHDIGDRVLRAVATYMKRSIRADDFCGRFGGEEFLIVVHGADLATAQRIAERHRAGIAAVPLLDLGERGHVTVSIGVADFVAAFHPDPESLLKRADQALYEAKRRGRNRVVTASPEGGILRIPAISVDVMPSSTPASARDDAVPSSLTSPLEGERAPTQLRPFGASRAADRCHGRHPLGGQSPGGPCKLREARLPGPALRSSLPIHGQLLGVFAGRQGEYGPRRHRAHRPGERPGPVVSGRFCKRLREPSALSGRGLPLVSSGVSRRPSRPAPFCQKARVDFPLDYLCGLLHDVGEGRVYRILAGIRDASKHPALCLTDLVVRYHARAGADIAGAWRLPKEIIDACAHHHEPGAEATVAVRVAKISDVLVAEMEREEATVPSEEATRQLGALEVTPELCATLCTELRRSVAQAE